MLTILLVQKSLMKFLEPTRKPKVIYTDNSLEFGKACEDLSWNHCTSTPHRSETNGIAGRAERRVKERTSAVLLQSGLGNEWWAESMECHCYLRNIQDLLSDGKTPYERRFGMPFGGPVILFRAMVDYHLYLRKTNLVCISLEQKFCQVYSLRLCVVCGENLERRHHGRRHWRIGGDGRIRTPRQKAQWKKVLTPMKNGKFHIPSRRWNSQNLWRRSTFETIHLNPGSSGTRRGSQKWFLVYNRRFHLSPSRGTPSQNVRAERRIISYSDEAHRRYQNNTYVTGCFVGENIDDYWNVDGETELSDAWTGFTRFIFLNERPPDGYTWSSERLTRKQTTSRPDNIWLDMWSRMSDAAKRKAKQKWAIEKPKLDNARQLRGIFLYWTWWWRI